MKKKTTHKIITDAVHFVSLAAAVFIFYVWQKGSVIDAPQMLQYVAWVEITNLAQYSAKSGYEHKHGIFDNNIAQTAVQAMQSNDLANGPAQVVQAVNDQSNQTADSSSNQDVNHNMAG